MALALSILLHPVFFPIFILLVYKWSYPQYHGSDQLDKLLWLSSLAAVLLPLAVTTLLWAKGNVSSLLMKEKKERRVPLLVTVFAYYLLFNLFEKMMPTYPLAKMYLGLATGILLLIVLPGKGSMHMFGVGGILACLFAFKPLLYPNLIFIMIAWILLGGLLGVARLKLKSHTESELYTGFLLGFFPVGIIYLLL